jgi:hypothetical protein
MPLMPRQVDEQLNPFCRTPPARNAGVCFGNNCRFSIVTRAAFLAAVLLLRSVMRLMHCTAASNAGGLVDFGQFGQN